MNVNATLRSPLKANSLTWALPALVFAGSRRAVVLHRQRRLQDRRADVRVVGDLAGRTRLRASSTDRAGFADYPPGYFYILGIVGWLWESFFKSSDGGHYVVLKALVKLPAILADLGVGVLVYAFVRRFARRASRSARRRSISSTPPSIYNSAAWGQVDSIAGGLALFAIYCLLRSDDDAPDRPSWWIVAGWLLIAYSLLIKPQAAVLLPLMFAFAFVDRGRRRARLIATAIGIAAAVLLALVVVEPFHPGNPARRVRLAVRALQLRLERLCVQHRERV